MTKISIIIPVYNVEEYLRECLNSVLNQSLEDIEVICVDDCSTDTSLSILEEYSQKDERLKVYHFDEPKSALQARKLGVLNATGKYVMFLDADDYLKLDACELLYNKIEEVKVDILHFSSKVVNCANLSQERIEYNQKLLEPYTNALVGDDVFKACFIERKFMITLWNKVFDAELCKKAFEAMVDRYLPKAQDLYSFFIMAYYAKSYYGWQSEPLHFYCFGRGVTGTNQMTLNKFERYNAQAWVADELNAFAKKEKMDDKVFAVIERYYNNWMKECINLWKNELPYQYSHKGLSTLYKYWGEKNIVSSLARLNWNDKVSVAKKLKKIPSISLKEKQVKRIGIYYYHFTIGGVQRVISLLAPMFKKMGYEVVLIFDTEPSDNDMILSDDIERVSILNRELVNKNNYTDRIDSWDSILENYQLDIVLYNGWTSDLLLWDLLYLKSKEVSVFIHAHSVFSFAINKLTKTFSQLPKIFRLADGMIVLSEADKIFWSAYNNNVYCIPNPIDDSLDHIDSVQYDNHSIIWVGRVSEEKQPEAIFEILEKVVKHVPSVKLYLVGNFDDTKWKKIVEKKQLQDNVIFCGMIHNVNDYLKKASIHLSTSKFEGFPMTLLEAQAHGLPTVMFDMCYLTLAQEGHGVIGVEMLNYNDASNEIVRLLTDREYWNSYSHDAKHSYDHLRFFDYEGAWKKLLDGEVSENQLDLATRQMIRTIVNHYEEGIRYTSKKRKKRRNKQGLAKVKDLTIRGVKYLKKNSLMSAANKFAEKSIRVIKRKMK